MIINYGLPYDLGLPHMFLPHKLEVLHVFNRLFQQTFVGKDCQTNQKNVCVCRYGNYLHSIPRAGLIKISK